MPARYSKPLLKKHWWRWKAGGWLPGAGGGAPPGATAQRAVGVRVPVGAGKFQTQGRHRGHCDRANGLNAHGSVGTACFLHCTSTGQEEQDKYWRPPLGLLVNGRK